MKKTICLAILVAFCLTMVVPVSASVYPEDAVIETVTFDNGITIKFPFSLASSYVVAFVGNGTEPIEIIYLYETVPGVLNYDNGVALMGYNLAADGKSCQADLYAMGNYYESVLLVENGVAEVPWTESFRVLHEGEPGVIRKVIQGSGFVCCGCSRVQYLGGEAYGFGDTFNGITLPYAELAVPWPGVEPIKISVNPVTDGPYYPGTAVQMNAEIVSIGTVPQNFNWSLSGATSSSTVIDENGLVTIGANEASTTLTVTSIYKADTSITGTYELTVTYPLEEVVISPPGIEFLSESSKTRTKQYSLYLPNGEHYEPYAFEWDIVTSAGHDEYFSISETGLVTIRGGAPVGASYLVRWRYVGGEYTYSQSATGLQIVSSEESIKEQLTPTPDQSDKAEGMEDAIGDAADKLENNNSSLGQLTPTRPQINTNLEFDQEQMLAVSPLVTNIWSINGLGRMISIVLVVATVAYIFFGKRDG